MILADTSAWIEYDQATGSSVDRRMRRLVAAGDGLAVTEPVIMEVLAGARGEPEVVALRRLLLRCRLRPVDGAADFEAAARIYRTCRGEGVTPRGRLDCVIAAVAWRNGDALLARDADVARIAEVMGIELDGGSAP